MARVQFGRAHAVTARSAKGKVKQEGHIVSEYTTTEGAISEITRLASSRSANPRYRVTLVGGAALSTGVDAAIGYAITNPEWKGTPLVFTLAKGEIVGVRTRDGLHVAGPQG